MHVPRRMVGGKVERFEVVEVVLDLGPLHDIEPEMAKEALDPLQGPGDRMQSARPRSPAGERDVDPFAAELGVHGGGGKRFAARTRRLLNVVLGPVERLTGRRSLVCPAASRGCGAAR